MYAYILETVPDLLCSHKRVYFSTCKWFSSSSRRLVILRQPGCFCAKLLFPNFWILANPLPPLSYRDLRLFFQPLSHLLYLQSQFFTSHTYTQFHLEFKWQLSIGSKPKVSSFFKGTVVKMTQLPKKQLAAKCPITSVLLQFEYCVLRELHLPHSYC